MEVSPWPFSSSVREMPEVHFILVSDSTDVDWERLLNH